MASFSPVCPAHIYSGLFSSGYKGDYFLLLAHDVAAHAEEYQTAFMDNLQGGTVIMDNSVIELGGSVDMDIYRKAVEVMDADVVVLPDVLEDGNATIKSTLDAFDDYQKAFPTKEFMIVPQGKNINDWVNCLQTLADNMRIDWIGIPRNTTDRIVESRYKLAEVAMQLVGVSTKIHLLGFSNNVADDIYSCSHAGVIGIDSAVPLRWASRGEPMWIGRDTGPRGDWWDTVQYDERMKDNVLQFEQYVNYATF